MNIAIVTDSTAVLSKEILSGNKNVFSIPLHIIFGEESYSDGIDLSQKEFFEFLKQTEDLPTTSQPSIGEVENLFNKLLDKFDHIIYITISSKISGTYESGMMARGIVSEKKITVFDSLYTSIIQKYMVTEAIKMVNEKKSISDIINKMEYIRSNSEILFVVDDLKHLKRTGRISATAASVGNVLQIKPVLILKDGKIELYKKVKSIKKAHKLLIDMAIEQNLNEFSKIIITQAQAKEYADNIKIKLLEFYPNHEISIDNLSPVISVHTGENTVGVAWVK